MSKIIRWDDKSYRIEYDDGAVDLIYYNSIDERLVRLRTSPDGDMQKSFLDDVARLEDNAHDRA